MSEEIKAKMKACFPEGVEAIMISKDDYDRLYGDLTYRNVELEQENQQLRKENKSLRDRIKTIKRTRKKQTQKKNRYKQVITVLQNSLTIKNNVLDEIREITKSSITSYDFGGSRASLVQGFYDINDALDKVKE